jgi:hypothetical protein
MRVKLYGNPETGHLEFATDSRTHSIAHATRLKGWIELGTLQVEPNAGGQQVFEERCHEIEEERKRRQDEEDRKRR